jgi:hypothetical protein
MSTEEPTPMPSSGTLGSAAPQGPTSPPPDPGITPPGAPTTDPATTDATTGRPTGDTGGDGPTDRGREVAGHARSEMEETAERAREHAGEVAATARSEVYDVVDEARDAVRRQADRQAGEVAGAVAELRDDLRAMSDGTAPREATAEYLQRAARSLDDVAQRLEREGIEGALSGVRRFARSNPGGFLLASAGAGFAVARLVRNADHPQHVTEQHRSTSGDGRIDATEETDREIDLTRDTMRDTPIGADELAGRETGR